MNDVIKVRYTASILADDRTTAALTQARKRCGAPKKAKMKIFEHFRSPDYGLTVVAWDEPNPVQVEFYWEEELSG